MTETGKELIGLSRETFDWIVGYLRERPYGEVKSLMEDLERNTRIVRVDVPEENPDE